MKKRLWCVFLLIVMLMASLGGCGKADKSAADFEGAVSENYTGSTADKDMGYDNMEVAPEESYEVEGMEEMPVGEAEPVEVKNQSKIIRTVNLQMETLYFDELVSMLTLKAEQFGGYVENSDVNNLGYYGRGTRSGYFRIRIPAAQADEYMKSVGDKGVIVSQSENLEDVTLQYVDTKSHIEMLQVERERLMELLGKAETLEEILLIEERLTSVRYELESYESQLKVLDNKINYTTIMIDVYEVEQITTPEKASMWDKIVDTFKDSLRGIRDLFEGLVIFVIGYIPYLVLLAVVIVLVVFLVKRKKKKQ